MYRQYENPRTLEKELEEWKAKKESVLSSIHNLGNSTGRVDDRTGYTAYDTLQDELQYYEDIISELEQRINFAWQDEEFG